MLDANGDCVHHGTLCIPPTWGDHDWRWKAGTWQPTYRHRPKGHAWVQPTDDPKPRKPFRLQPEKAPPTIAYTPPTTMTCEQCHKVFETRARVGGLPQRFCSRRCKSKAASLRAGKATTGVTARTCQRCGAAFVLSLNGGARRYCGADCQQASKRASWAASRVARRERTA